MSAEYLLGSLFRSGIMLAVVAMVVGILLRFSRCRSPRIHRLAWGFVILHGILWIRIPMELAVLKPLEKPVVKTSSPVLDVEPIRTVDRPTVEFVQPTPLEIFVPKTESTTKHSLTHRALPPSVLAAVWSVGFAGIVLVRIFGYVRLLILLRTATASEYRGTRLLLTDQIGPAIVRLPPGNTILVPKTFWEEAPDTVREGILKHELSHAEHHDGLKSFVFSTLAAVQWFNPAAWWAIRKFDETAEWRCDYDAYGNEEQSIVRFAESMLLLHQTTDRYVGVVPAFRNRDLAERIRRLSEQQLFPEEKTMKQILIVFLLAVIFCCGIFRIHLVAKTPMREVANPEIAASTPSSLPLEVNIIHGTVADAEDKPVAGVKVYLIGDSTAEDGSTKTDVHGRFSLEKPFDRNWDAVYAVDYEGKRIGQAEWWKNSKTGEILEPKIVLHTAERLITGTVVDAGNRPAAGILVAGSGWGIGSEIVRTDKDGKFQFLYHDIAPLLQLIAYKKGGGLDICPTEEIDPNQLFSSIMPPEKISNGPFRLKLVPIEPVKIRVVDEDDRPISGATVGPWLIQKPSVGSGSGGSFGNYMRRREKFQLNTATTFGIFDTKTDADGVAILESIPKSFLDGSTFHASGPVGHAKCSYGRASKEWKDIATKSGFPTMVLPRNAAVKGTVKLEDGTPIPDANIGLRWHNGSGGLAKTDKNGEFILSDNVGVLYNLSFDSDKGAAPSVFNFSVGDGSEEKKLDVVLKPGIRLYGKVLMPNGSPAKGYHISVSEKNPNPPTTFRDPSESARRYGSVYMTNDADKQVYDRNFSRKEGESGFGEYETLLPAVPREYSFRVDKYATKENPNRYTVSVSNIRVLGTEKEINLDFRLGEERFTFLRQPPKTTVQTGAGIRFEINQGAIKNIPMVFLTDSDKDVLTFENGQWTLANSCPKTTAPFMLRSRQPLRIEQDGDTAILKTESLAQIIGPGKFRWKRWDGKIETIELGENETATLEGKIWRFTNGRMLSIDMPGETEITGNIALKTDSTVLATGKYVKIDQGGTRILVGDSPEAAKPLVVKR